MDMEILEQFRPTVPFTILEEEDDVNNFYRKGEELGRGTFASVFEVVDVNHPQDRYAMKEQPKVNPDDPEEDAQKGLNRLFTEFLIPTRILPKHRNIVQIKDVLLSNINFYIVQELCESGLNLNDFYSECDEESARRIFKQLVDSVHFMHQYGVVHCDLNEGNILFADDDWMECKIIDFGVSKYKPHLAKKFHNFNPKDWPLDEETYEEVDIRGIDVSYLGIILLKLMQKVNPPYLELTLQKPNYSTCLPSMKPFHETAHDLLRHIGPDPYRTALPKDVLPQTEYILQHPWLVGNPAPKHTFRDLRPMFASLQSNLAVLRELFEDDVILLTSSGFNLPGKRRKLLNQTLNSTNDLKNYYHITENLLRGGRDTGLLRAKSRDVKSQHVVKRISRKTTTNQEEAVTETFRIYNELLIQLRILPSHEHIVDINDVFVDKEEVCVVREFVGMHTLRDFLPLATNDSASKVFRQIAETVRFMHLFGVVHMDLNFGNIVFTDDTYTNSKIVDFSKAFYISELAGFQYKNFQEQQWITPELSRVASNAHAKVDIKALGDILLAMMRNNGEALAPWPDARDLLSRIGPKPYGPFEVRPGRAQDLGDKENNPLTTFTMDQICMHKWCNRDPRLNSSASYLLHANIVD